MLARMSNLSASVVRTARKAIDRASDRWAERLWENDRFSSYQPVDDGEVSAVLRRMGAPGLNEYAAQQRIARRRRSFLPQDRAAVVAQLDAKHPWFRDEAVDAADRVRTGLFDLLGSGPIDLSRRGGRGLDWRRDPRTGATYPDRFSHWRAAVPATLARVGGDIKGPWEVGRCQHFAVLGQAYWLTGDERYADTIAATIDDFLEQNPPGCGVQWTCTMDVALRMVSWIAGLSFVDGARALTTDWWKRFLRSVVEHGRFIAGNLEFGTLDGRIVTSNHYLADLLGLHWIATAFPELDTNNVWRGLAEYGFEREMARQIHSDGGSFESSLPYQRLIVEMFLSAYALSLHAGHPFSDAYRDRLLASLRLIRSVRQPGGRIPQLGDCDNGRAHIFTGYGRWAQERMDHLLAAGARVLNCPELADEVDDRDAVEALFWDTPPVPRATWIDAGPIAEFPDSGLIVLRNGSTRVLFSNGPVGTEGFGNHKHCDQLAVEVAVGSQPVFVDAGSYVYTSDPAERNRFRGTAMHNTVMVDGQEQHDLNPAWLFRLMQRGRASRFESGSAGGALFARAHHTGYASLDPPITHEREVAVDAGGSVTIADRFDRPAGHRLRWHFLLHPDVNAQAAGGGVKLSWRDGDATLDVPADLHIDVIDSWYSPAYGVRMPTRALVAETTSVPATMTMTLRVHSRMR
jgi:hypothetical protein